MYAIAGSETFLLKVVELLDCIIRANPRAKLAKSQLFFIHMNSFIHRFVCDPVLGDDGKYYVPETLVKVFRESVVPKYIHCIRDPSMNNHCTQILHDNSESIRS